jgi:hypothetical protein
VNHPPAEAWVIGVKFLEDRFPPKETSNCAKEGKAKHAAVPSYYAARLRNISRKRAILVPDIFGGSLSFDAFANALQDLGLEGLRTREAKNVPSLEDLAGSMENVCESCHQTLCYPLAKPASTRK